MRSDFLLVSSIQISYTDEWIHIAFAYTIYSLQISSSIDGEERNEWAATTTTTMFSVCVPVSFVRVPAFAACVRLLRHRCVHFFVDTFDVYCQPEQNWTELSRDFALCVCLLIFLVRLARFQALFYLFSFRFLFLKQCLCNETMCLCPCFNGHVTGVEIFVFCLFFLLLFSVLSVRCSRQCML